MKLRNTYLLGALALSAAFASCSSDEPAGSINNDSTTPITLDTYVARDVNASRAAVETATTLQTSGFGVFGYYTGSTALSSYTFGAANLMSEQQVTYNSTSKAWEYTPLKYWSKTSTDNYQFLAYAPYSSLSFTDAAAPTITYDASTSSGYDLMTAFATDQHPKTDKVPFTFSHRLSRIGFMAKAGATYSSATITVTKAVIKGATLKGTYALWDAVTTSTAGWSNTSTADYSVTTSNHVLSTTSTNLMGDNAYLFVIPAASADLELLIDYKITQGDVTYEYTNQSVPAKSQALAMGSAYNFVVTISLNAIEFDVVSVTDWGNTSDLTGSF